jgi:hypothetical protein|tara:strand:+ start:269 stop:643 length:375 start_codon:yes stop_codon:yes gene_type:complete
VQNNQATISNYNLSDEDRAAWDNAIHPTIQTNIYSGIKAPDDERDAELLKECYEQKAADALKQVDAAKYRLKNAELNLEFAGEDSRNLRQLQQSVSFACEKVAKMIDTHRFYTNAASAYWYYLQ